MKLSQKGRIHITNGLITKSVTKDSEEYLELINSNWKIGDASKNKPKSQEFKNRMNKANIGKKWLTYGIINKRLDPTTEEYINLVSMGYRNGFTTNIAS